LLSRAQRGAARLDGRQIALRRMDAESMEFADDSFDCVAVPYVLSVTPDPQRLVRELRRVCVRGGTIILLNHFSGSRYWSLLDKAFGKIADKVGFRSDFSYEEHVLAHDWKVESVAEVNVFGLSRLVVIKNV
jgi:phosphatidylethanolamine/phosphatidyl-N-methylethanolamine N-methyltransferase